MTLTCGRKWYYKTEPAQAPHITCLCISFYPRKRTRDVVYRSHWLGLRLFSAAILKGKHPLKFSLQFGWEFVSILCFSQRSRVLDICISASVSQKRGRLCIFIKKHKKTRLQYAILLVVLPQRHGVPLCWHAEKKKNTIAVFYVSSSHFLMWLFGATDPARFARTWHINTSWSYS